MWPPSSSCFFQLRWRLINKLWGCRIIQQETGYSRGLGNALEFDLIAKRLELGIQLCLVYVLRHIVASTDGILYVVAHIHEIGHFVLQLVDFVNVHLAVLLAQLLCGRLHGVDSGHCVFEVVLHHPGLLHVPRLSLELVALGLVHFALLQHLEGLLLDGRLAGPIAHLAELLLVGRELCVELGKLDIEAFDTGVNLDASGSWPATGEEREATLEMALAREGLGAVFFAPKRRFMVVGVGRASNVVSGGLSCVLSSVSCLPGWVAGHDAEGHVPAGWRRCGARGAAGTDSTDGSEDGTDGLPGRLHAMHAQSRLGQLTSPEILCRQPRRSPARGAGSRINNAQVAGGLWRLQQALAAAFAPTALPTEPPSTPAHLLPATFPASSSSSSLHGVWYH